MSNVEEEVRARLLALRDERYHDFQCSLMPTVDPETVIGVRMPALRAYAKELAKTPAAEEFLCLLPHRYYEENNLHGLLIDGILSYQETVAALDAFLPFVDNWATCDLMAPKAFAKHPAELPAQLAAWIADGRAYHIRFAVGMLNRFYLDEAFEPRQLAMAAEIRSEEYYVNMMRAWYFATALAKQYDAALPYLTEGRLDIWTHNKAIQKACESYRVPDARKAVLRTLRRTEKR